VNCFVVDASVVVKWLPLFRDEPLLDAAIDYLNRFLAGQLQLWFQGLFWIEIGVSSARPCVAALANHHKPRKLSLLSWTTGSRLSRLKNYSRRHLRSPSKAIGPSTTVCM
jgi:hypothetical protein